jgi:hypothetical protein
MKNTRSHFTEKVLHNYNQFLEYFNANEIGLHKDILNAGHVAESLNDIAEYLYIEKKALIDNDYNVKKVSDFKKELFNKSKDYNIVCNFGDAAKHHTLNRKDRIVNSIDDAKEWLVLIRFEDEKGYYYIVRKSLIIKADNTDYLLQDLLYNSIHFMSDVLIHYGIIPNQPAIEKPVVYKKRENETGVAILNLIGRQFEYFSLQLPQNHLISHDKGQTFFKREKGDVFCATIDVKMKIEPSVFSS